MKGYKIFILILALSLCSLESYATSSTRYAKLTVQVSSTSTGKGLVYASTSNSTPSSGDYSTSAWTGDGKDGNNGLTITLYAFAKANQDYHLKGWASDDNTANVLDGSATSPYAYGAKAYTKDRNNPTSYNLWAVFERNIYSINYNANGGSGTISSQTNLNSGDNVTLKNNTGFTNNVTLTYNTCGGDAISPAQLSNVFEGWRYNGNNYTAGGSYSFHTDHNATVTMSARWSDASVTLPTPTKTVAGFARPFLGWYDAETGGEKVGDAGATYNLNEDKTIYARWSEYDLTISVQASNSEAGERVIFKVQNTSVPAISFTVPIQLGANNSVTLKALPGGTYSVQPTQWSWNYTPSPTSNNVNLNANKTASFTLVSKNSSRNHDEAAKVNWGNQ